MRYCSPQDQREVSWSLGSRTETKRGRVLDGAHASLVHYRALLKQPPLLHENGFNLVFARLDEALLLARVAQNETLHTVSEHERLLFEAGLYGADGLKDVKEAAIIRLSDGVETCAQTRRGR